MAPPLHQNEPWENNSKGGAKSAAVRLEAFKTSNVIDTVLPECTASPLPKHTGVSEGTEVTHTQRNIYDQRLKPKGPLKVPSLNKALTAQEEVK